MKRYVSTCVAIVQQPAAQIDLVARWSIVQWPIAQLASHAERAAQS